ncbi:MAG TPA: zinc dependent phospholipase C family protein [Candidatus Cybelea sp.]|nr:zinc dependent phospholipase C family protein [Candidatus Cybelea sp.]
MGTKKLGCARKGPSRIGACLLILFLLLPGAPSSGAYSVLTHEAIVDAAWVDAIRPTLLKRFPDATPAELKEAHAYAYGGCAIQDVGYYPFGSKFFSDLVHYVRTGDFIEALLRDSSNIDEYAFALGALAHDAADNDGHRMAVNRAVPILYPKLGRKYGADVTYDEDPAAHLKTEFSFDVLQVAKGHYAPDAFHDYIGFEVSEALLERAFQETYSLDLKSLFTDFDLTIGTYRRSVSEIIPEMTKVAWQLKKDDIQKDLPGVTRQKFLYHLSRADYERQWNTKYKKPSFVVRLLVFLTRLIPKIGPFRTLTLRVPTPETDKLFMASFNATLHDYEESLRQERDSGKVDLVNDNFDTGTVTGLGEYPLADKTYAELLNRLANSHFKDVSIELRADLLDYYATSGPPPSGKKDRKGWERTMRQLDELRAATTEKPAL